MCMNDDYHVYTCNSCAGTYMRIFRHKDGGFVMLCATCGTTHSLDQVFPVQ